MGAHLGKLGERALGCAAGRRAASPSGMRPQVNGRCGCGTARQVDGVIEFAAIKRSRP